MGNLTKIWFFLLLFSSAVIIGSFWVGERQGLLVGFAVVIVVNALVYYYGDTRVRRIFKGRSIIGQDPWGLDQMCTLLSRQARVPRPEIIVIPLDVPTALSTGRNWRQATIFLSEGLLRILNRDEIRAVMAHEISKIKRLDTFALSVSSAVSGAFLFFARGLDRLLGRNSKNSLSIEEIVSPIGSLPVHLSVGQSNYYKADQLAAKLLGKPQLLAQVLWKLHSYAGTQPVEIPHSTAHLFIVDPLTSNPIHRYFQKHPPVEKRIEKLVGYFPI